MDMMSEQDMQAVAIGAIWDLVCLYSDKITPATCIT